MRPKGPHLKITLVRMTEFVQGINVRSPEDGIVNGAQRFLGSQGVDVPASTDFNWDANSNFSIELWVNIPADETCDGARVFVGRHAGTPAWWVGCQHGSNMAVFTMRDSMGVGKQITGGPVLNDGEWHHIVVARDDGSDENQLFVDGNLEALSTVAYTGDWISEKEINFGYYNVVYGPPYYHFAGLLDEIAIYGRALPLDEIQYHYGKGLERKGYCEPVSLEINVEGNGSVEKSAFDPYTFGQIVTLTANPEPGMIFYGWSGDLTGLVNPATITMDSDKVITATFTEPIWHTLTVDLVGQGSVVVEPDKELYLHGDSVSLEAVVEPGWLFSGWGGDLNGDKNPAEILMTASFTISANFLEAENFTFLPLAFK
jgi:hypothetical protein